MTSTFTISLDFELHWGGFEKWPLNAAKRAYFDNTRKLIPELLRQFEQNDVHVTWATVGMLMHSEKSAIIANQPTLKPTYEQAQLSAYHFMATEGIGENEREDPYHFAHSLVQLVTKHKGQELASHSFAHYYCNEAGQTLEQFEADCQAIKNVASTYGVSPKSLVFPRNQYNADYLKVCGESGIRIVRSNPVDWWWKIDSALDESKWKRLNRGLDAYFNIGGKTSYSNSAIKKEQNVYLLPASRLLRPYNPKEFFLNKKKINRIKKEMTIAAENGEFYHLWWHPHNFGLYPEQSMEGLNKILSHFKYLKDTFNMRSLNMSEIAEELDKSADLSPSIN